MQVVHRGLDAPGAYRAKGGTLLRSALEPQGIQNRTDTRLSQITQISAGILQHTEPLSSASSCPEVILGGAQETARIEDMAYCLFGIFNVNLRVYYTVKKKAFRQLQEEIIRKKPDLQHIRLDSSGAIE